MNLEESQRFWSKVDLNGPVPKHRAYLGRCWIWTGGKNEGGYGRFFSDGKTVYPHRLSYESVHGRLKNDCLHRCDNPSCVRPSHLFDGTQLENYLDSVKKGRNNFARGDRHGSVTCPGYARKGQEHGMAKLSEKAVRQIKAYLSDGVKGVSLAKAFGISQQQICNIRKGRVWRHL